MKNKAEDLRNLAFQKLAEGDVKAAYDLISQVVANGSPTLDDLYLCGEFALDCGHYTEAIELLSSTISESINSSDSWYLNCAYIERAYARFLEGELELAEEDLKFVDDSPEIFWLSRHPILNKKFISEAVAKQKLLRTHKGK